jgi:type 1 fimbria pilin
MRKFIKIMNCGLFATALLSSGIANAFTGSETHDLTLTGSVRAGACSADVPATLVFDKTITDAIPNVNSIPILSGGVPVGSVDYLIDFNNCGEGQWAQLTIMGAADEVDSSLLANSKADNAATNVAVAFWSGHGTGSYRISVNTADDPVLVGMPIDPSNPHTGRMILTALLVKPENKSATAGVYSSVAQMKIDYL